MGVVREKMMPDVAFPIESKTKFYALFETQGSRLDHDQEVVSRFVEFMTHG